MLSVSPRQGAQSHTNGHMKGLLTRLFRFAVLTTNAPP